MRLRELDPLLELVTTRPPSGYEYVSVHAPSRFDAAEERAVVDALARLVPLGWPIVLHPDTIHDVAPWRAFGSLLAIENMDKRKAKGRTVDELERFFERLPEAMFCFDIGHAQQVDRTMNEADFLLERFGPRLLQLHVSEVNAESRHDPLSRAAVLAFQKVAPWVPEGAALILESPARVERIDAQIALALEALPCPS